MGTELVRAFRVDLRDGIDPKTVLPYLPIIELFRVVRMRDPAMDMSTTWKEIRG